MNENLKGGEGEREKKPVRDETTSKNQAPKSTEPVYDENLEINDGERIPIRLPLKVLRYRTLKKNHALGWWSAVVLLEDHEQKQICFYRWKRRGKEWKRDKKLPFRSNEDWCAFRDVVESFLKDLG